MTLAKSIRTLLLLGGLLLTAACSAHNDADSTTAATQGVAASSAAAVPAPASTAPIVDGTQYVRIAPASEQSVPTGPIVMVEVFSYGCPHCAEFAPYMDKLRAQLSQGAQVRYMPAVFSEAWVPYARAFYAAKQLGVLDKTHGALFKAMLEHYPLNSLEDLANFYERQGVDPQQFLATARSDETTAQMSTDLKTEMGWGINATPTLVVGRAQSDAANAPFVAQYRSDKFANYAELQRIGLRMVDLVEQPSK